MLLEVFLLYLTLTIAVSASPDAGATETYVTKYDNINLEQIFASERLMNNYMNCLKKVGPCTPDGQQLKANLPDALMSDCAKCSEKQRIGADKVIKFIVANRPDDFATLESLYDPTGEYRRKYLDPDGTIVMSQGAHGESQPTPTTADGGIEAKAHATEQNSTSSQDQGHGDHEGSIESE
ncbi:ejaculatory bulb-specific protein 3-like [Anopheles aquasalis]|uniref:ejaculatory bulb-specific protein 3-like n=1 Tax=Anopheles aquasalis TaxID=42839 RepID=UPI00215AE8C2|nr:ejaculatory bulb-specific protein 3-like [Anopheles aquasalis]